MNEQPGLPTENGHYTVSELLTELRQTLEKRWSNLWVAGEISNLRRPSSGHFYFSLKDEEGQLRAVMFRGFNRYLRFEPADGMQVLVRAAVTVYQVRGDMQLAVQHMEQLGEGSLQRRFQQLKEKLATEGLFDQERKKALPRFPLRVGVVTSPTGAALQDILNILGRRAPWMEVIVAPCRVQGDDAAAEIRTALQTLDNSARVDIIVITRGGGSLEDLQPFNEENVARAVAETAVPVVSAVGHETDVTICDFAADLRVPTPSAAAEVVSAGHVDLADRLRSTLRRMALSMRTVLSSAATRVEAVSPGRLCSTMRLRILDRAQRLDEVRDSVEFTIKELQSTASECLAGAERRLARMSPLQRLGRRRLACQSLNHRLSVSMRLRLERQSGRVGGLRESLEQLSPLAVLGRGYSICRTRGADGRVVRHAEQVVTGDGLDVLLHRGRLVCRVERTDPAEERRDEDDRR